MNFQRLSDRVFQFRDTCNVYAITSGPQAVLIDFGTGSIVDHLNEIGVRTVDWVLHTHHHRDQCQGDMRLLKADTRVAVPAREADLFQSADAHWQTVPIHNRVDCTNVYNSPLCSIPVDLSVHDYEHVTWRDLTFIAHPTPGHTKGSLSYLAEIDGLLYAFCGDLIFSPGRVWTIHDFNWSYVIPDGLNVALHSVRSLGQTKPTRLAPSHGSVISAPDSALNALEENLLKLYGVTNRRFYTDVEAPIKSSLDHGFRRVSKHLLAIEHCAANFYVLTSSDGSALAFDYGFPSMDHLFGAESRFVGHSLVELNDLYKVRRIDVAIPTHYHNDHVCGMNFLKKQFGTEVWMFEGFSDILERPHAYRLPTLWHEPITAERLLKNGETFEWNEYHFTVSHNPGHTWYAAAFLGEVDGRRIAVTGDELLLDGTGLLRGGGPVYRNRVSADCFTTGIRTIIEFEPDIILSGHNGPIEVTRADLEAVYRWAEELEESWRALAADTTEIEFALDPDFVSVYPYQSTGSPGTELEVEVMVRNHHAHEAECTLRMSVPVGWRTEPAEREFRMGRGAIARIPFSVFVPTDARVGDRYGVAVDVELGELRLGQAAEGLICVKKRTSKPSFKR